ncbi:MAG: peptidylprolyl isomerase [Spirochaetes bacterium]|nr:peptidylprolyl isomerase [Spirochaetota bacterium]
MKKLKCSLLILAVAGILSADVIDRVIAVVNDDAVTMYEYNQKRDTLKKQAAAAGQVISDEMVLNELVRDLVLKQQAKKYNIVVADSELKAAMLEVAKQNGIQTAEEFEKRLRAENVYDIYAEGIKKQLLMQHLFSMVLTVKEPSDEDAEEYFKTNKTSLDEAHVFWIFQNAPMQMSFSEKGKKRKLIDEAYRRVSAGGDFAAIAKELSDDPNTRDKGGDMGWLPMQRMAEFAPDFIARGKKAGFISDIKEDRSGFWFIKVTEVRKGADVAFRDVKTRIKNELYLKRRNDEFTTWLDRQMQRAVVKKMR